MKKNKRREGDALLIIDAIHDLQFSRNEKIILWGQGSRPPLAHFNAKARDASEITRLNPARDHVDFGTTVASRSVELSDNILESRTCGPDEEQWGVVIETPKGSRDKHNYSPEFGCYQYATTLPDGMAFPFDFGFRPSTVGEDGHLWIEA